MFVRILLLALLGAFLWAVFARPSGASREAVAYRVRAGDTLWSIAERRYAGDPREGVWRITRRNHLGSASIVPGEVLVLP